MAQDEHPVVQQLEGQLAQIRERLARKEPRGKGWWLTLTGLSLGALAGGVLAYALRSREEEAPYTPPPQPPTPLRRDDAIVLKPATAPAPTPAPVVEEDAPIELKPPTASSASAPAATAVETPTAQSEDATNTEESAGVEESASAGAATIATLVAPTEAPTTTTDDAETEATAEEAGTATAVAETAPAQAVATGTAEAAATEGAAAEPPPYPGSVLPVDNTCPASHPIKGNLSRNNVLIFHVPGSNNYDRTHPEACFATEAAAEAAGFRKARS